MNNLNADRLLYFLELSRTLHVGRTAVILSISKGALSQAMSLLEEELGVLLFDRVGRRLVLTDKGALLKSLAEQLKDQLDTIHSAIASSSRRVPQRFTIGVTHGLEHLTQVKSLLGWLTQLAPGSQLEYRALRSSEVFTGVLERELNFGICFEPQSHPQVEKEIYFESPVEIYVAQSLKKRWPKDSKKQKIWLSTLPFAAARAGQGIENCERPPPLVKVGLCTQDPQLVFDSYAVALEWLKQGHGWALLPSQALQGALLKSLHHLNASWLPEIFTRVCLIHHRREKVPAFYSGKIGI